MLKLVTIDNELAVKGLLLSLTCAQKVEQEFLRVLNWNKDAFWDKESLKLMKTIDAAERKGDYGVITQMGSSCITCLSTGCKFGLLVLHYKKMPNAKILVAHSAAGENVWQWIAENTETELYVLKEDINYDLAGNKNTVVFYKGNYIESSSDTFWEMLVECKNIPYEMTKEAENTAYDKYRKDKFIDCNLKEELLLSEYIKRFPDYENMVSDVDEYEHSFETYQVINYCNYIPEEFPYRRHPLYLCGKKNNVIEFQKINSVKYPTFLELLYFDVLYGGCNSKDVSYLSSYEMWYVLVLNGNELCRVEEYPKKTIMGIEVNLSGKSITILNKERAIERFHELYGETT